MEKYLGFKQLLGFIVIVCGLLWIINTIGLLGSLLLGIDSFSSHFTEPNYIDGEWVSPISLSAWRGLFWSSIISSILIKILGGSLSKINGNGYKSD